MNKKFFLPLGCLVLFFIASSAIAHQTGVSWEKTVGGYKVDIGYDPTTFVAGQSARFDFNAFDSTTRAPVDFSDVWVRIYQGEQTVFATGIHKAQLSTTGMIYTFPSAGDYSLYVRFENGDKNFVETAFPITVGAGGASASPSDAGQSSRLKVFGSAAAGLIIGFAAAWLFIKGLKKHA